MVADQKRHLNVIVSWLIKEKEKNNGWGRGLPPDSHLKGPDGPGELLP